MKCDEFLCVFIDTSHFVLSAVRLVRVFDSTAQEVKHRTQLGLRIAYKTYFLKYGACFG